MNMYNSLDFFNNFQYNYNKGYNALTLDSNEGGMIMKRFVTKLSAVALSICMLVPTLSNSAAISYGNAADDTKSSDLLFNNEDQFFVYVGTYKNSVPQFRYLYPTSDGSYNADKVIWENAPAGLAYGDIFVAEGDVPMTQVYPAKDDPANAHVYYYTLDEGAELIKAGNCPDLMEKKDMSVTSKTYDGSSHWSIRYMDAAGKEYYYGLSTFASSLDLDPLDCEVGDVYTYALYNDHMVVPLAKQTGTITDTMTVEVVEVHDKYLLVKPTDRPNSNERLTLSTKYLDSEVEPSVGMKLEVTYTDGILETYPEEFGNVKKVSVVSDDTVASGDVNNDGAFNVSDVVLLQKWLLAVPDTELANWKAADFCKDNKLDVFDLCLMKRALLENIQNPVEPPADHIAPLGFKTADDAIKEIIQSDLSEIEGYAQMFERFRNDGFIYHFTDAENAITLCEDHPNAAVWLMPYDYFEDTGILYHVVYQGKDYQVYYYFTAPAFPASDLWDYMEQRLHTDQVKVVDGKYGIVHHPNGGQPVVSAYFAIDDTHYCKVKTFEPEDALMDFLQVLSYEKLDIADNTSTDPITPVNVQPISYKEMDSTEGRITSERTATTESSSSSIQKSTEPTSQQIQTQEVLNRKNYVSNLNEITNVYSAEEIIDYIDYCSGPNAITFLYLLDEKYPIEYFVRPAGASPYCIYKVDEGEKLFVFFNENEESLCDVTYFFLVKDKLTRESFAEISAGATLADVESIDQGTQLIDSINANSLSKGFTLHMVENGFIKITYEGGNVNRSKIDNLNDFIVKEIAFIPNGNAIDIPRIFGDGPVHYTIIEYN